jgi:hypothetical protein
MSHFGETTYYITVGWPESHSGCPASSYGSDVAVEGRYSFCVAEEKNAETQYQNNKPIRNHDALSSLWGCYSGSDVLLRESVEMIIVNTAVSMYRTAVST